MDRLEYTRAQDPFFDFCLWEYKPVVPYENKFRSANLLFHSFDFTGIDERIFELVQVIRKGFGFLYTVWGVKQLGNEIAWEFYFYDYRRRDRERSITQLLELIKPFVKCEIPVNENYHYFMFSIDISDDLILGKSDLEEIHMYIGNPGSTVSSGICYSLTSRGTHLENFYFFFNAQKHIDEIMSKIVCSAYIDATQIEIDRILWPELKKCKVIVVANKQRNDSIYFSGIDVNQLIFFLKSMNYPRAMVSFVEENRANLDHLQYDVGFDYHMCGKDLGILKSAYYGIF
jgi:hypothetical protein